MESQNMTQQTFSDFIGISSGSLSSIFNGRTNPTLNTVEAIRGKFPKINLDWLISGVGPMFHGDGVAEGVESTGGSSPSMEPMINFDNVPPAPTHSSLGNANVQGMGNSSPGTVKTEIKYIDKPQRQITEIRIFYNDQTYESFVPKK